MLKSWHLPHVYTHGGSFWYFISIGIYEKSCYYCSGSSNMHAAHLQKRYVFWMVLCFTTGPALLFSSHQVADNPGSDVADICIPMNVPPLPSLDICHDHYKSSPKYKRRMQRNMNCAHWRTKDMCNLTFTEEQRHTKDMCQRNMKCVHQSTKFVCNVTWSVFTTVKRHVQRNIKCLHRSTKDVHSVTWSVFTEEMTCAT